MSKHTPHPPRSLTSSEMTDARIEELRERPVLKLSEKETRELISYYDDEQLREISTRVRKHIKNIARKQEHFKEYWRCKDILKWVNEEECSRPMTSDFLNKVFKIK